MKRGKNIQDQDSRIMVIEDRKWRIEDRAIVNSRFSIFTQAFMLSAKQFLQNRLFLSASVNVFLGVAKPISFSRFRRTDKIFSSALRDNIRSQVVRGNIQSSARLSRGPAPQSLPFLTQEPVKEDRCGVRMRGFIQEPCTSKACGDK